MASSGSSVAVDLIDRLAVNPYLTINEVAEDLKLAYSSAQRALQKLENSEIIRKTGDNKRHKVILC